MFTTQLGTGFHHPAMVSPAGWPGTAIAGSMPAREQRLGRRRTLEPPASIQALPLACSNEVAAVEFVEKMRWGDYPACVHCGGEDVYRMADTTTGGRNKRFLWRCRSCKRMFTVRIGTVFEDSRLELRHWCYAFWRASTSKEGVAARDVVRQCRMSYKSALFLMHRVRQAIAPADARDGKQPAGAVVECDETGRGRTPRPGIAPHERGGHGMPAPRQTPEFTAPEPGPHVAGRHVVTDIRSKTLAVRPGPAPETVKLGGFWQANIARALQKKRPPGGGSGTRGQDAPRERGALPEEADGRGRTDSLDRAASCP